MIERLSNANYTNGSHFYRSLEGKLEWWGDSADDSGVNNRDRGSRSGNYLLRYINCTLDIKSTWSASVIIMFYAEYSLVCKHIH